MNGKSSKVKPKMADVTKPKKTTTTDTGAEPLVIQSRPMISHATSIGSPSADQSTQDDSAAPAAPQTAPVLPSQSRRTLIVPISDGEDKEPAPVKDTTASEPAPTDTKPEPAATAPKVDAPAETPKAADAKDAPEPAEEAEEEAPDKTETDEAAPDDDTSDKKDEKPNPETEKAIAEAAAAAKRERELEALIDSKQFYVPINAVARKREVKHSALMTVVVLLLAFVLIDFMLDSGLILLAEKIPHTHFFTTSSINQ